MTMIADEVARPSSREVVFSRLLAAPVALVWEMWADVRHLHEWFGPTGFTITTQEFEFAPGGLWRFTMHAPDGHDNPSLMVFRSIEPKARIVYTNSWHEPDALLEFTGEVTLAAEGQRTRLILRLTFDSDAAMQMAVEHYGVENGGRETFERLARYAEG
jgi:uncharacterized protein YndB with AHSA1/START domain